MRAGRVHSLHHTVALLFAAAGLVSPPAATASRCPGDCGDNGAVEVQEIAVGVDIALDALAVAGCPSFDGDGDGRVTVDELVAAAGVALRGCPRPSPFPIGAYFWPDHAFGQAGSALGDLADFGLDTVVAYYEYVKPDVPPFSGQPNCAGLVREAEEYGIDFFIGGPHGALLRPLDDSALNARLQATVDCVGGSPHYRGWMIDEPELNGYDAELMRRVAASLRRTDPSGRIWINFHPYATEDEVRRLGGDADILGFDIYPIREGNGSVQVNRPLTDVGVLTRRARELTPTGGETWMIVQAFGYSDLPAENGRGRRPTPAELRFMVYDALAGDADGIVFFGSHQLRNTISLDSAVWDVGVRRIASELKVIGPTLRGGERKGGVTAVSPGVEAFAVRDADRELVIARNTTPSGLDGVLRFEDAITEVVEIFDARHLLVAGGELHDTFLPHGVHVYEVWR
jgi:hypothetical protein